MISHSTPRTAGKQGTFLKILWSPGWWIKEQMARPYSGSLPDLSPNFPEFHFLQRKERITFSNFTHTPFQLEFSWDDSISHVLIKGYCIVYADRFQ